MIKVDNLEPEQDQETFLPEIQWYTGLTLHKYVPSAQLMRNTGMLFANDANPDRAKAIVGNLHRLGVTNCVVSKYDGRLYPQVSTVMPNTHSAEPKCTKGDRFLRQKIKYNPCLSVHWMVTSNNPSTPSCKEPIQFVLRPRLFAEIEAYLVWCTCAETYSNLLFFSLKFFCCTKITLLSWSFSDNEGI